MNIKNTHVMPSIKNLGNKNLNLCNKLPLMERYSKGVG